MSVVHVIVRGIIGLGYFVVLTTVYGVMAGKMAMEMKVVDEEGRKPGFALALVR